MVFSGLYPIDGTDYPVLRDALDKLKLNDAALDLRAGDLGRARASASACGFLGLLHLEIVRERLEREFDLDLISTAPNVVYEVTIEDKSVVTVTNPSEFPAGKIGEVHEPMVKATILSPAEFIGAIMELCQTRRGELQGMDYLSEERVELRYVLPHGRDRLRLLRPAEVQDPRLRLARLRARSATRTRTWSRSTSCCRARRSTRSARSCTRTRPTRTAS